MGMNVGKEDIWLQLMKPLAIICLDHSLQTSACLLHHIRIDTRLLRF